MRILFIIPTNTKKNGGNWVTANRLAAGLIQRGIEIKIIEACAVTVEILRQFDVLHFFHTYKTLFGIKEIVKMAQVPWVLSFTGTDLEKLKSEGDNKPQQIHFLNQTKGIFVFHEEARVEVIEEGVLEEHLAVIRQSTTLTAPTEETTDNDLRRSWGIENEEVVFLYAGGIRRVKGPLEAVEYMRGIISPLEKARLVILGPILENDLGSLFLDTIKGLKEISYEGEFTHCQMPSALHTADVVINTSISEGMPNTIIEAMGLKKPILARNIAGNRAVVQHGKTGFLYNNQEDFSKYALELKKSKELRLQMGQEGFNMLKEYTIEEEINKYLEAYHKAVGKLIK